MALISENAIRIEEPGKKGLRSLGYSALVFGGAITGGFSSIIGSMLLGAAAVYSGIRTVMNGEKMFSEDYREKRDSYFGRAVGYLTRTVGTITMPYYQSLVSLLSGGSRLHYGELQPWDFNYPELAEYEMALAQRATEQAAQEESSEE